MDLVHKAAITLLRSGITGEKLPLPPELPLEEAFGLLRQQSVVPLACEGAVNCGVDKQGPVLQPMLAICYRNLMRHELQMKALREVFAAFEENEIAYMPLKGCTIKDLYPRPELRAMGDADILIHGEDHRRIRPLMEGLGFAFCGENDHVFEWRAKNLFVELHKSPVPPDEGDYYAYYGSGWQLGVKSAGSRHDLSAEDAYLFMFTHFARHYRRGGIGCRHVVDLFVYRRAFPALNTGYIRRELEKLHLLEFHDNVARMLQVWFSDLAPDGTTELITAFIFSGGNWGTMEASMFSESVRRAKQAGALSHSGLRSVLRVIFPPVSQLSYRYGAVRRFPVLLPVIWVVRWIDILLFRPRKIRKRVRILRAVDDDRILSHQQALEAVGLDFN